MRKLALDIHSSGGRSLTKEQILEKFSRYLPEVNIEDERAEDVLDEIVQRNVLIKEVSIGVYEFLHLSFQEYFAALELRERKDYEVLLEHLYDPWWEEVILLIAGFDRDSTELIRRIQKEEKTNKRFREDIFYSNLMLMGKCIADADYTDARLREEIVERLWFLYQTAEFSSLRENAIGILGLVKPKKLISSLIEELSSGDSFVRLKAVHALGMMGSERALDRLIELTNDEEGSVRESAAEALGRIGSERALDRLIELTIDESIHVRWSAAEALGRIGSERALDRLIELTIDESIHVRWSAAEALGRIGSERALDRLIELTIDESICVRESAAEALGRIGSERALDRLIELTRDKDSFARCKAAEALGKTGNERAIRSLKKALKDEEIGYRGEARDAAFDTLQKLSKKLEIRIF